MTPQPLPWLTPREATKAFVALPTGLVRTVGASGIVLLRVGEAATLAAAAGMRAVLDLTWAPLATAPGRPPVSEDATDTFAAPAPVGAPASDEDRPHPEQSAPSDESVPVDHSGFVADATAAAAAQSATSGSERPGETAAQDAVAEPPVPLWDQLTVASIRGRLRTLRVEELHTLLAYEAAHSARPQVVSMLENRIARVESPGASDSDDDAVDSDV